MWVNICKKTEALNSKPPPYLICKQRKKKSNEFPKHYLNGTGLKFLLGQLQTMVNEAGNYFPPVSSKAEGHNQNS